MLWKGILKCSFIPAAHTKSDGKPSTGASEKRQERESDRAGMKASVKSTCSALKHQSCRLRSSCLCGQAPLKIYFMELAGQSLLICPIRNGALYIVQLLKQVGLDHFKCEAFNGIHHPGRELVTVLAAGFWHVLFCCLINRVLLEMTWLTSAHTKDLG